MKELYKFSHKTKTYCFKDKLIIDQIVDQQDFSECFFSQVHIFNCNFLKTSFRPSDLGSVTFKNCIFKNVSFAESELTNVRFENCEIIDTWFGSWSSCIIDSKFINCKLDHVSFINTELIDSKFINCKLDHVSFGNTELADVKFNASQLKNTSFASALLDTVKAKNSSFHNITFENAKIYKLVYQEGKLIANRIPIKDYDSFLKEVIPVDLDSLIRRSYIIFLMTSFGLFISLVV